MKKVFAFISVLALTIAVMGLGSKSTLSADEKWTKDPTITDKDIPMYIMNSIYTTFPNDYDYQALADPNWGGASRMYPWNETKLQVKLMDAAGSFTGKEYAIYFSGATKASEAGAGNNIGLLYVEDGKVVFKRKSGEKATTSTDSPFMDPSLSHLTTNVSGQTVAFDATKVMGGQGGNYYNRMLVFDAQGRMIRGLAGGPAYVAPWDESAITNEEGKVVGAVAEFCYVDGKLTKYADGVVCDKVLEQKKDEEGNPVLNGEEPVMVETDKDNFLYQRYVWEWVEKEAFSAESVNTVGYLEEGWDANKWDFAWEQDGGYMCVAFVSGEGSNVNLTPVQLEVYTATCAANGLEAPTADSYRSVARTITIPNGGFMYDFGYLDKGFNDLYVYFIDMFNTGYKFGRNLDAEGNGMAYTATFNYSAKPLTILDVAYDGHGYTPLEGQNVIEVMQGATIKPSKNVDYNGIAKYWQVQNDVTSFKGDTSVLDLEIRVNGTLEVTRSRYTSFAEMRDDFMKDYNEALELTGDDVVQTPSMDSAAWDAANKKYVYGGSNWYEHRSDLVGSKFLGNAKYAAKWAWLFEYYNIHASAAGRDTFTISTSAINTGGSIGNVAADTWGFFAQAPSNPSGWPRVGIDWDQLSEGWLDARTVAQKWEQFTIDTTEANVDKNYTVVFTASNPETGNSTELTITYVVVDEYTPVLEVNKNNLIFTPNEEAGKVVMPKIDKFTFASAFNGQYNGTSLKGDDISYKVHYTSETLDFDNPTEGNHKVTATVYNKTKFVSKTFTVVIEDLTAPRAFARDITLPYGSDFHYTMGITYAWDNVDGNLMNGSNRNWASSSTSVDTKQPGTYNVSVKVSDITGNTTTVTYKVTVVSELAQSENGKKIADIQKAISELQLAVEDTSSVDELKASIDELKASIAEVNEKLTSKSKCKSKGAYIVEFLAATSLLVVFLKRKH